MKTFQQFINETDIEGARLEAKKSADRDRREAEKRANEDRKRADRAKSVNVMQQNIQRNSERSKDNSARLDALSDKGGDNIPSAPGAVGGGIVDKGKEMLQKKQIQNKQRIMIKQQQLEKQKVQKQKQFGFSMK